LPAVVSTGNDRHARYLNRSASHSPRCQRGSAHDPDLRRFARASAEAHALIAGHEKVVLGQCQQSAACNAAHFLPERLAKWLLLARDRLGTDRLQLTQEFIAEMVGVRRTSVTIEAHQLQQAGLIRYRRGFIEILKPDELKEAACECYQVVTRHFARLFELQPNISEKENKS
jgi:Crp-like helix-turn-helix protein